MEIPGFRNALLTGLSRRLREADEKLAEYAEAAKHAPDASGAMPSREVGQ